MEERGLRGSDQGAEAAHGVWLIDLTTGPRVQVMKDWFEDVTIKPLFAGGAIWVNDTSYYASYGSGFDARRDWRF